MADGLSVFWSRGIASKCGLVQIWPETPGRLQAVQNVLASVVDIGAKTDYDNTETRMLSSIMAPETKKTTCRRKARGVSRYIVLYRQCHLKLIWIPRSK